MSWLAEYEYGILWILFQEQCRFWCLEGSCLVRQFHKSPTRVYRDLSIYIAQPSLQVLQPSWKNAGSTCFCYKSSFTGGTSWNSTTHFAHLIVFFGIFWYILYNFSSWINRNPTVSSNFIQFHHPFLRFSTPMAGSPWILETSIHRPRPEQRPAGRKTDKTCGKKTIWVMGVSENSGTPKSSILIGFSIINHYKPSILGFLYFWKHPYGTQKGRFASTDFLIEKKRWFSGSMLTFQSVFFDHL